MSRLLLVLFLTFATTLSLPSPTWAQAPEKPEIDAAQAQKKPLTKEQVLSLVQNQIGDETGARAIEQRGIDFEPTEEFLQELKSSGANPVFIQALRSAKRIAPPPAAPKKPLTQFQILSLLVNYVSSARVARLVAERGIDFDLTDDYLDVVRKSGGDEVLVTALRQATVTKPPTVDPSVQARTTEAQGHMARGNELYQKKQYAGAELEFRAALNLQPDDPTLHSSLGACLQNQSKPDAATAEYLIALRLDPENELAHKLLGTNLFQKGDFKAAIGEFRKTLELNPDDENVHMLLGNALEKTGDRKGGMSEYREALRLNANNDQAHVLLGAALLAEKDVDGAIAEFGEAVRLRPDEASYKKAYDALLKMPKGKKKGRG